MHKLSIALFSFFLGALTACAEQTSPKSSVDDWKMPHAHDEIHMTWLKGPPFIQAFRPEDRHLRGYREEATQVAFRSGRWGILFDPRSMELERIVIAPAASITSELLDPSYIMEKWSEGDLDLLVSDGVQTYRPQGGKIIQEHGYSPVRVVESGQWFHHLAIYDLDLVSETGEVLEAESWLEIRAWGDRATIEWFVESADAATEVDLQMTLRSQAYDFVLSGEAGEGRVFLGFGIEDGELAAIEREVSDLLIIEAQALNNYTPRDPVVEYSDVYQAWTIQIPKQRWPEDRGLAYNRNLLERISRFDLTFENSSSEPRDIRLRILHEYHPLTGYVPMMADGEGQLLGLPMQNSKNWHMKPDKRQPYDHSWIHVSTRISLAPGAKVDMEYLVAHAQWEGLPASSAAQLCLIGWGFNGFWTQMALGAWGETLCVQAGRTMRRSFITDVRPFMVKGYESGEPYDWTTNVGGADIAKLIDVDGKLVLWQGAVQEYRRIGPVLSEFRVTERSECERLRARITSYLPRSRSIHRSFFKVELLALEDIEFGDLTLFQLGADYYNSVDTRRISWGDENGKRAGIEPSQKNWGQVAEPIELTGEIPWFSLFDTGSIGRGNEGKAVRGMVVRDVSGQVDGVAVDALWLSASRTKGALNAELRLSPELRALRKGDRIEFLVEMDVFPMSADDYYGPDESLQARLKATPDSWELTAHEAKSRGVSINGEPQSFPATLTLNGLGDSFEVSGLSEMDIVIVDGLPSPDASSIKERLDGQLLSLGERFPEEANPQINYDVENGTWSVVLSIRLGHSAGTRTFVLSSQ